MAAPRDALGPDLWLRLAESRERDRPADALAVYQRIADEVLETSRSARVSLRRADPRARTGGGAGRRRARRVRGVPRAFARAAPATADPDRDPGQGQPPQGFVRGSALPRAWTRSQMPQTTWFGLHESLYV